MVGMTSDEEYTLAGQVASRFDSSSVGHRLVAIVSMAEALDAAMDCFRIRRNTGLGRFLIGYT
jgi:hypothetical protein